MKNLYIFFTSLFLLVSQLKAQAPNDINYQGVARNSAGLVLQNQTIGLRFTIHQGSAGGSVVYQETQTTTTNLLGLFTLPVGSGTVQSGNFANIAWGANTEFLQVEMDPSGGTSYLNMGTTQFLSVPYSLYSGSSASGWNLTGNSGTTAGTNFIGTSDAKDFVLKTNATERVRVLSTGNVGIGTSSPQAALEVDQNYTGGGIGMIHINSTGSESGFTLQKATNGSQKYSFKCGDNTAGASYFAIHDETSSGTVRFLIASSTGNIGLNTTTPKSRLDVSGSEAIGSYSGSIAAPTNGLIVSGNVGIGNSSPAQALDVTGSVKFSLALMPNGSAGTSGQILQSNGTGAAPTWVAPTSSGWSLTGNSGTNAGTNFIGTTDANDFVFKTRGIENMRIANSTGYIGIATSSPAQPLDVTGNVQFSKALMPNSDPGATGDILVSQGANTPPIWTTAAALNGTGDNWGAQTTVTDSSITSGIQNTLSGTGIATSPLKLARQGATAGQVLEWNGASWAPATASNSGWNLTGNSGTTAGTNFIGTSDAKDFVLKTNATERVRVLSTGNVGIGTSSPQAALEVDQNYTGGGIGMIHINSTGSESGFTLQKATNGSQKYSFKCGDNTAGASYFSIHDETAGGAVRFLIASSTGNIGLNTTTPKSRLDVSGSEAIGSYSGSIAAPTNGLIVSGNVGIGNSSPAQALDVTGSIKFSLALMPNGSAGTSGQILQSNGTGAAPTWVAPTSSGWSLTGNSGTNAGTNFIGTTDANDFVFKTRGIENMRIANSTGYIGIATSSPAQPLDVTGNVQFSKALMPNSDPGATGDILVSQGANTPPIWTTAAALNGTGDNWGAQTTVTDSSITSGIQNTLSGTGIATSPLKLARQGATAGQVLEWNGASWAPATASNSGWNLAGNSGTTAGTNFIGTSDAKDFVLKTNATERVRVLSTGNVGIGTSSPQAALEVDQNYTGGGIGMIHINSTGSESGFTLQKATNGSQKYSFKCGDNTAGASYFSIHDETAGGAVRFLIASSTGNIGLNTTTPKSRLDVSGSEAIGSYSGSIAAPTNGLIVSGNVGVGTSTPNSSLQVNGSISLAIASKTIAYTMTAADAIVLADAASASFNITLPTAVGADGRQYIIKKKDSSANTVTINTTSSQTIDGAATYSLPAQWKYITVVSDGSNWVIVANN